MDLSFSGEVIFHIRNDRVNLASADFGFDVGINGDSSLVSERDDFLSVNLFHGVLPIALAALWRFTSSSILEET